VAALAALRERDRSGIGQRVDVSLLGSTLALLVNQAQNAFVTRRAPGRRGNAHPNIVPYETFATADGEIAIAVGSERQWPRLCHALGLPALADDPRFATNGARVEARGELRETLADRFAERTTADWLTALDAADVPAGSINDVLAAFDSPAAVARAMRVPLEHERLGRVDQVGVPFELARTPAAIRTPPPLLGEHTEQVLAELGLSPAEVADLRERGVV
jgi:crotonobetainyl-CoA:carnitine CoA-transferase CaiB-like acyl-CoA transferase